MSWISERTGLHWGNIGAPVGAAIGSVIPGVGTAIGAGLGQAIGGIGHGDGVASSALQGASTYGGAKALGGALGGGGSVLDKAKGVAGALGGGDPSGGGDGGFLQGAKSFLGDHMGDALIGGGIANAAYNQSKAGDAMGHALDTVNDQWKAGAPLREQGMAGMLNPGQGIAGKIGAIPQGANPYAPGAGAAPSLAPASPGGGGLPPMGHLIAPGMGLGNAGHSAPGATGGWGGAIAKLQAQGGPMQPPGLAPARPEAQ